MAILDLIEPRLLRVNDVACLKARHKDRHCKACLACPTGAIHLDGSRVQIEWARCNECGWCAAVCPVHAVWLDGWNENAVLDIAAPYSQIEFTCSRKENPGTTRTPNAQVVLVIPCLARLSSDLLTALAAEHTFVWLNDSACTACLMGERVQPQILATRDQANNLLATLNRDDAVRCCSDTDKLSAARTVVCISPSAQPLSRREFFSYLTRHAARAAGAAIGIPGAGSEKPASNRGGTVLGHALTKLGAPEKDFISSERFATINVAESCTACGLCAKFCPTQAIQLRNDERYFALTFLPRDCLGIPCALCELFCPADALTITPGIASRALVGDAQKLHAGTLALCEKCHTLFAADGEQGLCSICRAVKAKDAALIHDLFK